MKKILFAVMALVVVGCSDSGSKKSPGVIEQKVNNTTDVSACKGETPSELALWSYRWEFSGAAENGDLTIGIDIPFKNSSYAKISISCNINSEVLYAVETVAVRFDNSTLEILEDKNIQAKKVDKYCQTEFRKSVTKYEFQGRCLKLIAADGSTSGLLAPKAK